MADFYREARVADWQLAQQKQPYALAPMKIGSTPKVYEIKNDLSPRNIVIEETQAPKHWCA